MKLAAAMLQLQRAHGTSGRPLALVLAGHNGSGKSTLWYERLAGRMRVPLINADRMMLSILPEATSGRVLPRWASRLRDRDPSWMGVAQKGVEAFVAQAMAHKVPFAMETVFSHLEPRQNGTYASKADLLKSMQSEGYFTLLVFVGLASVELSVARVATRVAAAGHDVARKKLLSRFPRTQRAIGLGLDVADASLLVDNSGEPDKAFTPCRVEIARKALFDVRAAPGVPAIFGCPIGLVEAPNGGGASWPRRHRGRDTQDARGNGCGTRVHRCASERARRRGAHHPPALAVLLSRRSAARARTRFGLHSLGESVWTLRPCFHQT